MEAGRGIRNAHLALGWQTGLPGAWRFGPPKGEHPAVFGLVENSRRSSRRCPLPIPTPPGGRDVIHDLETECAAATTSRRFAYSQVYLGI
jgi:hypothetical protein